jgi:CelD/BcsL family acetyltransferase involved in cellulose biosynthesis
VKRLSLAELERVWVEVEDLVDQTADIDKWCSGPDWVLPVHQGFGAGAEPLLLASDDPSRPGYALLARYQLDDHRTMVAGLEPLWGFASPLIGPDIAGLTHQVVKHLATGSSWDHLVLPGMPALDGAQGFTAQVAQELSPLGPVGIGEGITRQVADLSGGYDQWLSQRSSRFRRNLVQARQRGRAAGLAFVDASADPDIFDRLVAIEAASWKGLEHSGIMVPEMRATYRAMTGRLGSRGRLRVYIACLGATDVGYILGGVRGGRYRGLQLSYRREASGLSVGHLLQHHQLSALCATGEAHTYDLGMDLDYKRRWADGTQPSFTLVVNRKRPLP